MTPEDQRNKEAHDLAMSINSLLLDKKIEIVLTALSAIFSQIVITMNIDVDEFFDKLKELAKQYQKDDKDDDLHP